MILFAEPTPVVSDVSGTIVRPVSGGAVLFSHEDPATERYRLVLRAADGTLRTFRIRSRAMPFDVDVGPDERGREVAVYSRCATEPPLGAPIGGLTYYRKGLSCRLYELSLATGRERRLHTPTERSGSDMLPAIWRGRLVWQHVAKTVTLMLRDHGRTRRLRAGTPSVDRIGGVLPAPGVLGLDLRGDRLSLVWSYYDRRNGCGDDFPFGHMPVSELWTYRLGVSRRRVMRAGCEGDAVSRVGWAQLTPAGLRYSVTIRNAETLIGPYGRRPLAGLVGTNFVQTFARLDDGRLVVAYDGSANGLVVD